MESADPFDSFAGNRPVSRRTMPVPLLIFSLDFSRADDKILVQMSSAADIKDKAVREPFLAGLKQVIADLRQEGVKEFESVADALSVYGRRFIEEKDEVS